MSASRHKGEVKNKKCRTAPEMPISQVSTEWEYNKKAIWNTFSARLYTKCIFIPSNSICVPGRLQSSAICRSEFAQHDAGLRDKVIRFSLTLFKCSDLWKINRRNLLTRPSRASNSRHQSFCTAPRCGLSSALDSVKLIGRRYWRPVVVITVFTPIFRQLRVDFSYQTVWLEKRKEAPGQVWGISLWDGEESFSPF